MLKKIITPSVSQRQAIFLPQIPQESMPVKNANSSTTSNCSFSASISNETGWQLNWINLFDDERKKAQTTLANERDTIKCQEETIKQLRGQIAMKEDRLVELKNKCRQQREKMSELKHLCKTSHKSIVVSNDASTGMVTYEFNNSATQTDQISIVETLPSIQTIKPLPATPIVIQMPNLQDLTAAETLIELQHSAKLHNQVSTSSHKPIAVLKDAGAQMISREFDDSGIQSDEIPIIETLPSIQAIDPLQNTTTAAKSTSQRFTSVEAMFDHPYAIQQNHKSPAKKSSSSQLYKCKSCPYFTPKKSSMDDHRNEFCTRSKANKNMECAVCKKKFTYRGLRLHFNYYIKSKHIALDGHSKYSRQDHEIMLAEHKNLMKNHV